MEHQVLVDFQGLLELQVYQDFQVIVELQVYQEQVEHQVYPEHQVKVVSAD